MRTSIAVLLGALLASACTYWRPSAPVPETVERQEAVRVRPRGEGEFLLRDPWMRNDSIGGRRAVRSGQWVRGDSAWAAPLVDVAEVRTKQPDTARTVLMVVGGVGVAVSGAVLIMGLTCCS